jgi:acetyl esterase/lipase
MIRLTMLAVVAAVLPLGAQTSIPVAATDTKPPAGFTDTIVLWPNGAPLALRTGTAATDGDVPKLFTYPAAGAGPHAAVIVMPGGGYTHLAMDKEGSVEARWLAAHGISAFVLEYRLSPAYRFPAYMLDGSRAVRYVRAHAADLGVIPSEVGVWGFSAGGHLAAYLSTVHTAGDASAADPIDRLSDRPDFAIISYGRMDLSSATPRPAATAAAPGMEIVMGATTAQIDILPRVTADNSPSFIYSTTGDQTVDSRNASGYYAALKAAGVPAELHIFELGPHGTGFAQNLPASERELTIWPTLLANWLQLHHFMAEPQ